MMGGVASHLTGLIFRPLLPWPVLAALAVVTLAGLALAIRLRMRGWPGRALAAVVLLAALTGPALRQERREALSDIVVMLTDASASQSLGSRPDQTARAAAHVSARLAALPGMELRRAEVADAAGGGGTELVHALARALEGVPPDRLAGVVILSDGQAHDGALRPDLPAPTHLLLSGHAADWDRRLTVTEAPSFAIIGEETSIGLRIEDEGAVPPALAGRPASLTVTIDDGPARRFDMPVGRDLRLPLTLGHGGQNVVQITVEGDAGELTGQNNRAVLQMNGVRDRLRVLLVSGEPYAGERTWRNLLKSDASVDLVHFTILRPPDKEDGVPVDELSLIAFPTRELFVDKISDFDLIIFDRYPLRGILPAEYLDNIRDYVLGGGAVLVAAGPDYASADSLFYSGLGDVLPADPTNRVIDGAFLPKVSAEGHRHPVTAELEARAEGGSAAVPGMPDAPWGRWLRYVEVEKPRGQVLMTGPDDKPLLVLNREGKGRVALLASDQAWLWARGYEGGGPQQELLRRLAHWMMKEPDLEEEALLAEVTGTHVRVQRRTMGEGPRRVTITGPDGQATDLPLSQQAPGRLAADWQAPGPGLYRLADGDLTRIFAVGNASPREFDRVLATDTTLDPLIVPTGGGVQRIETGLPDIRLVRPGRPAFGRGWIGLTPRGAYRTLDLTQTPLIPAWAALAACMALMLWSWLAEGRRR